MRYRRLKVDAVSRLKSVLRSVDDISKAPDKDVAELLSAVAVRLLHLSSRLDRDQQWLEGQ
jgi:hypothetical protein